MGLCGGSTTDCRKRLQNSWRGFVASEYRLLHSNFLRILGTIPGFHTRLRLRVGAKGLARVGGLCAQPLVHVLHDETGPRVHHQSDIPLLFQMI